MTELRDHARRALDAGLCVLPAATDGSKRPAVNWKNYQERRPTPGQIDAWFGSDTFDGLGYICGNVSGNLEMFEFEARAVDAGIYDQFVEDALEAGLDFVDRIDMGYTEESPAGGRHWLYRVADAPVAGNLKLARQPGEQPNVVDVLIETRGEGGWTVAAPSAGRTHPTGRAWRILRGGVDTIATITADQRAELLNLARTFDRMPALQESERSAINGTAPISEHDGDRPGDVYNRETTWPEILEPLGWTFLFDRNGVAYWRRPGKTHGISATTNALGTDRLKVFSSSTTFDTETTYDKLGVYARLNHAGNISAAASDVADRLGITPEPVPALDTLTGDSLNPKDDARDPGDDQADDLDSWAPIDLAPYLDGTFDPITPTIGELTDGRYLFYLERVSVVFGQSGDGKTWVAYAVAAQLLAAGEHVLWCDLEDSPQGTIERLRLLGVDDDAIRHRFHYLHPDEPLTAAGRARIGHLIEQQAPALCVIDSTGESVALEGLNPDKDEQIATWGRKFPRWIAARGPAVVLIDHVPKSRDRDPLYAIGNQRKRAMIDGAAYLAEMVVEFGRGRLGKTKLTTAKDRGGNHERKKPLAMFILDARETPYEYRLEPAPDVNPEEVARVKLANHRHAVSAYIADRPGILKTDIRAAAGGLGIKPDDVLAAVDWLVEHDYVDLVAGGKGGAKRHTSKRTYDPDFEDLVGDVENEAA